MKIKVGVIFGGNSVEHEVSIISAIQAMDNMDSSKYEIIPIYISKDNEWYTSPTFRDLNTFKDLTNIPEHSDNIILYKKDKDYVLQAKKGLFKKIINTIDIAFPIVHGTNVEDGILQGYLETINIPYVGSGVYASVVGQDKIYMKDIFKNNNLPIPKYTWFYDNEYLEDENKILANIKEIGYPVIVKPATLGSSVGISKADNEEQVRMAINNAIEFDNRILVEEVIANLTEVNISVLGNFSHQELSVIEKVNGESALLTYEDKYLSNSKTKGGSKGMVSTNREIPAKLSAKLTKEVEQIATKAFKVLNSRGVVRIDFLIDSKADEVYINEINNIPGSLAFYLWEATNKKYSTLIDELISLAIKDYQTKNKKIHSFNTNILNATSYGVKGLKK